MPDEEATSPTARSAAAKEKTKQQSRPVSGRQAAKSTTSNQPGKQQKPKGSGQGGAPAGKAGGRATSTKAPAGAKSTGATSRGAGSASAGGGKAGAKGSGTGQRPPRQARPAAAPRRSPTTLLTWGAVGLVLVIVVALVVVKFATGGSTPATVDSTWVAVNPTVAHQATNIPTSVYNEVGIKTPAVQTNPPTVVNGQPPLTYGGKPGAYYFGAEYCPYCAAERWAIVASLSRFGKFSGLGAMQSSSTDVFPNTQTFTFLKSHYDSSYLALKTQEYESNVPLANGNGYTILQNFTGDDRHLVTKYDTTKYVPGTSNGAFPFFDIGNKMIVSGASYSPSILGGLTRDQIAAGLDDPTNPVTQAIVATSNYMSAGICATTKQQPADVCTSKGVTEAAKALKLSS